MQDRGTAGAGHRMQSDLKEQRPAGHCVRQEGGREPQVGRGHDDGYKTTQNFTRAVTSVSQ